ncbi:MULTISPECIES: DUF1643 domain-containing protein [Prochlorococcus]|uniref:DUF1643 domain-containing protein n=1 Tax=Prochlorococcus TaxID=1218 RepID=UPI0007B34105|nr:DUF1643 domain-containing protein [Prochlorococcus marinus]
MLSIPSATARPVVAFLRQVVHSWASEAAFSSCGHYRWWLKRSLGQCERTLLFIGLNPSTATASEDDPTLRRLLGFCCSWGYGHLLVVNLFARISQSTVLLKQCADPIGDENDDQLLTRARQWSENPNWDLWFGWGCGGTLRRRDLAFKALLERHRQNRIRNFPAARGPLSLGLTREGHPCHPLYMPCKEVLRPFNWASGATIGHPE